jgi:hypothetical protein
MELEALKTLARVLARQAAAEVYGAQHQQAALGKATP